MVNLDKFSFVGELRLQVGLVFVSHLMNLECALPTAYQWVPDETRLEFFDAEHVSKRDFYRCAVSAVAPTRMQHCGSSAWSPILARLQSHCTTCPTR